MFCMITEKQLEPLKQGIYKVKERRAGPLMENYTSASLEYFSGMLMNRMYKVRESAFSAIARRLNNGSNDMERRAALFAVENAFSKGIDPSLLLPVIETLISSGDQETSKAAASLLRNYALKTYGVDITSNWKELGNAISGKYTEKEIPAGVPALFQKTFCELAPNSLKPFLELNESEFLERVQEGRKIIRLQFQGSEEVIVPEYKPVLQLGYVALGENAPNVSIYAQAAGVPATIGCKANEIAPLEYAPRTFSAEAIGKTLEKTRKGRKVLRTPYEKGRGIIWIGCGLQPSLLGHSPSAANIIPVAKAEYLPIWAGKNVEANEVGERCERGIGMMPHYPRLRLVYDARGKEMEDKGTNTKIKMPCKFREIGKKIAIGIAACFLLTFSIIMATARQTSSSKAEDFSQFSQKSAYFARVKAPEPAPVTDANKNAEENQKETQRTAETKVPTYAPREYVQYAEDSAKQHGVDPELVKAIIKAESNWDSSAISKKGAEGLMQLMPNTADELGVENPRKPKESIDGGTRYMRKLLDRFDDDVELALVAYNWGLENAKKYAKGETGLPAETKQYLGKIRKDYDF